MDVLKEIGRVFENPDDKTYADFLKVMHRLSLSEEKQKACNFLLQEPFHFSKSLGGENGSARLLTHKTSDIQAVMKTYEPTADPLSGYINENTDRIDQLREEVAAFVVGEATNLVHIPPTVLRKVSSGTLKTWGILATFFSSHSSFPKDQVIMLQEAVPEGQLVGKLQRPLPDLENPQNIFGLLFFDYLIAYGDGRFGNLLINSGGMWPIDHGKSFRLQGTIRGLDMLGIPPAFTLVNTLNLRSCLDEQKKAAVVPALETLLGKAKTAAFIKRWTIANKILAENTSLTANELKQEIEGK